MRICINRSSELDGSHTGEVVLYWVLVEQARHEHMSDEFKGRYIIQCCRSPHHGSIGVTEDHHIMVPTELT